MKVKRKKEKKKKKKRKRKKKKETQEENCGWRRKIRAERKKMDNGGEKVRIQLLFTGARLQYIQQLICTPRFSEPSLIAGPHSKGLAGPYH